MPVNRRKFILGAAFSLLLVPAFFAVKPVAAETTGPNGGVVSYGIAMHDDLAMPADFTHFPQVNPDAPRDGTVRYGVVGSFDSLNPFTVRGNLAGGALTQFDTLMARNWNEPYSLYCLVCETVEVPADRSWIAFTLRKEARFQDGAPVTVDDVIWSFEIQRDKGTPGKRAAYGRVTEVTRFGDNGVKFTFQPGVSREQALLMGGLPILPRHVWENLPFEETYLTPRAGSGPYKVKSLEAGRYVEYERVEDYWARDLPVMRGYNNFKTVRYDYYRDATISLEAFLAGSYDYRREVDEDRWASQYNVPSVTSGQIVLEEFPYAHPAWMKGFFLNQRRDLFKDIRVRQALDLAFDFEFMNRSYFHGAQKRLDSWFAASDLAASGSPSEGELALMTPWKADLPEAVFGPMIEQPKTDGSGPRGQRLNLREADKLLSEAGWTVKDGRRVNAEGKPFSFEVLYTDGADEPVILEWANTLRRLGIELRPYRADSSVFTQRVNVFDFDVQVNRLLNSLSPGTEQLDRYHGSAAADSQGSRNWAGLKNPAVDAIAGSIANARTRGDLVTATHALDRILMSEWLVVPWGYVPTDRVAHVKRLHSTGKASIYGIEDNAWWSE